MRTIHTEKYYTAMEHLLKVYDRESRKLGYSAGNLSEHDKWKKALREKLAQITGMNRMERCELASRSMESVQMNGYRRDKVVIRTEPDVWMPFYILIPDGLQPGEKRSCIIAPHGHGGGGKYAVAGREDIPAVKDKIEHYNYDYGVKFVQEGYIVFCPDARAFGERREWTKQGDEEEQFLVSSCVQLNHMAISLGLSVTGMWIWDLMRLVDYIETCEYCDSAAIGCCGLSGGGLQTLWLGAMDDRVKAIVVSGYFYGYRDSLLKLSSNCGCNYVPGLMEYADMGDLGALLAPRPFLIESGSRDPLNGERGMANVTEQLDITRKAYRLFDAEDKLYHHIFDGPHMWNGDRTYEFINRWLGVRR